MSKRRRKRICLQCAPTIKFLGLSPLPSSCRESDEYPTEQLLRERRFIPLFSLAGHGSVAHAAGQVFLVGGGRGVAKPGSRQGYWLELLDWARKVCTLCQEPGQGKGGTMRPIRVWNNLRGSANCHPPFFAKNASDFCAAHSGFKSLQNSCGEFLFAL